MSFDNARNDFMRDYDAQKKKRIEENRAKAAQAATAKPRANPAVAENKRLKAELANMQAKIERAKGIAVEMSKRSARMSNVPGYVLKNYADEVLKHLNAKN